jgi:hypothetical protein
MDPDVLARFEAQEAQIAELTKRITKMRFMLARIVTRGLRWPARPEPPKRTAKMKTGVILAAALIVGLVALFLSSCASPPPRDDISWRILRHQQGLDHRRWNR